MRDTQEQPDSAGSVAESRKKVTAIAPQQTSISSSVIGFCTLDLMPILLGNNLSLFFSVETEKARPRHRT